MAITPAPKPTSNGHARADYAPIVERQPVTPDPSILTRERIAIRTSALNAATAFVSSRRDLRSKDLFLLAERLEHFLIRPVTPDDYGLEDAF